MSRFTHRQLTLQIPRDLYDRLTRQAAREDRAIRDQAVRYLRLGLEADERTFIEQVRADQTRALAAVELGEVGDG